MRPSATLLQPEYLCKMNQQLLIIIDFTVDAERLFELQVGLVLCVVDKIIFRLDLRGDIIFK